jgi:hypothetical protein
MAGKPKLKIIQPKNQSISTNPPILAMPRVYENLGLILARVALRKAILTNNLSCDSGVSFPFLGIAQFVQFPVQCHQD